MPLDYWLSSNYKLMHERMCVALFLAHMTVTHSMEEKRGLDGGLQSSLAHRFLDVFL